MALRIHAQMETTPAATALLFFSCPYAEFVSSKLMVCNRGAGTTFTIWVVPGDVDAPSNANLLYSAEAIAGTTTREVPSGITLARGDTIFISSAANTVTMTLFGEGIGDEG